RPQQTETPAAGRSPAPAHTAPGPCHAGDAPGAGPRPDDTYPALAAVPARTAVPDRRAPRLAMGHSTASLPGPAPTRDRSSAPLAPRQVRATSGPASPPADGPGVAPDPTR